jgi:hypothetical protein
MIRLLSCRNEATANSEEAERLETRRVQYALHSNHELTLGQMRFQAMAAFLVAAGFISANMSRHGAAAALIALGLGLLILDLRNRALAWSIRARCVSIAEEVGFDCRIEDPGFRGISHTTVFDLAYGGVIGYASSLFLPWHGSLALGMNIVLASVGGLIVVVVAAHFSVSLREKCGLCFK